MSWDDLHIYPIFSLWNLFLSSKRSSSEALASEEGRGLKRSSAATICSNNLQGGTLMWQGRRLLPPPTRRPALKLQRGKKTCRPRCGLNKERRQAWHSVCTAIRSLRARPQWLLDLKNKKKKKKKHHDQYLFQENKNHQTWKHLINLILFNIIIYNICKHLHLFCCFLVLLPKTFRQTAPFYLGAVTSHLSPCYMYSPVLANWMKPVMCYNNNTFYLYGTYRGVSWNQHHVTLTNPDEVGRIFIQPE